MADPKPREYQRRLEVYVDDSTYAAVQEAAARNKLKLSQWVKLLIAEALRKEVA